MHFDIYELIEKLSTRTAMYTGKHTLSHIRTYLDAYSHAMCDVDCNDIGKPEFSGFHKWIAQKYDFQRFTAGYPEILLAVALDISPDDVQWETYDEKVTDEAHKKSVSMFFDLVGEYKNA
jgi:hypothetical protein